MGAGGKIGLTLFFLVFFIYGFLLRADDHQGVSGQSETAYLAGCILYDASEPGQGNGQQRSALCFTGRA